MGREWGGGQESEEDFRLAELIASLSLATDLANAFPMEKGLKNCLLSLSVAQEMGIEGKELCDVYYVGLLRSIGCTSYAHEEASLAGDDISFRNTFAAVDFTRKPEVVGRMVFQLAKGSGPVHRFNSVTAVARHMKRFGPSMAAANCEAGALLARRLGLGPGVSEGLNQIYERWDGKGIPNGLAGDEIAAASLVANFCHVVSARHGGDQEATCREVRRRSGGEFSPRVVEAFLRRSRDLLSLIETDSVWDLALDAEPEPRPRLPASHVRNLAHAFAQFADLKSRFTLGHSAGVANLSGEAAKVLGLSAIEVENVFISALLHDIGRVSVSNAIWEKKGALTSSEWERVRLHPYYSERILGRSVLESYARNAGAHHERLDGSGYHRGLPAALLALPSRILASADAYHAMIEDRPHRPALSVEEAAHELRMDASAGVLDRDAVAAVLEAAGHRKTAVGRSTWPSGLTDREVEVLRLVARGLSNKQIAAALFISDHTAHHHVLHIYQKIGLSTRAGAALFAMENDLLYP